MLTEVVVAWEMEGKIQDVYVYWLFLVAVNKEALFGEANLSQIANLSAEERSFAKKGTRCDLQSK